MEKKVAAAPLALIILFAASAGTAAGQQASGMTGVRNSYTASLSFWDRWAVRAYCATWDGMPLASRQRYGWAVFCGPVVTESITTVANFSSSNSACRGNLGCSIIVFALVSPCLTELLKDHQLGIVLVCWNVIDHCITNSDYYCADVE
ncbi:hypothetical protein PR202_ga22033 [Eleusine coracana subsp. coracana]|uniref:Barwin domain-containing protein n=1 Tax=Eleusine coracana subsp. coracana TaxID=191504 RepID=A0AAV5D0L2_ELECO|nr:hypothetical protein PR202_ga22033 [Eleusine coracana subsp. coracana]